MKKITIKYTAIAPISHIGKTASTGSAFQTILTSGGKIPVITGNSIRGQLRDSAASRLLELLDTKVDKETFNVLFSGGNLNGEMKDDIGRAKQVREHFPMISLFGGGLGSMIMAGKMTCSFAIPICKESEDITGRPSFISYHSLVDEIEFTRMDDCKNDIKAEHITDTEAETKAKASTQMRFEVQYMAAGTEFIQTITLFDGTTSLELGAFYSALLKWFELPRLGGMAAKGFGFFDAVVGDNDITVNGGEITAKDEIKTLATAYENYVKAEGNTYLDLLKTKGGKKNGEISDNAD